MMDVVRRKALTAGLQKQVAAIAKELREKLLAEGPSREKARALHAEEKVGEDFDVWTDLLSRRAAVLWVLKTVYVRVLEDRGLCRPRRIADNESLDLFAHLAPNLGHTAYLRWVFRDLASPSGGLPELFSPQPAEVAEPSDALSKQLIAFWQAPDEATGRSPWRFDDEHFDGRLMGDLYQDLDPVVKERYALLQTPDFILDFILDQTLTPAIAEWGVEKVRLLDPACGSGHFLLAALKRLVQGMREKFPQKPVQDVVGHCLERVVGIDLNDYACGLARARLVMTALELTGETELSAASSFHPQVYWADGLEQIERDEVGQGELKLEGDGIAAKPQVSLTRPEVREKLRPLLRGKFEVVVGNPPYITEKDPKRKEYHREQVGKERRYVSAAGKYSLGAPFTERMFQLAAPGGWVGEITANSFMKREFGAVLIEKVLPREDLFKVVDTSGAHIPGHGTPTVLLLGRHQAPTLDTIAVVMGKRGEPGIPGDPAQGKVWSSILESHQRLGHETEFVSTAAVPRAALSRHPWSIGGGGAAELKSTLEVGANALGDLCESIGITSFTLEDSAYIRPESAWRRLHVTPSRIRGMLTGDAIRNWSVGSVEHTFFPYNDDFFPITANSADLKALWAFRTNLSNNILFGGHHG